MSDEMHGDGERMRKRQIHSVSGEGDDTTIGPLKI